MRFVVFVLLVFVAATSFAQTQVRGYYKKNGTYVAPHTRSSPNSTKSDNYGRQDRSSNSGSYGGYGYQPAYSRDADKDGISNQNDYDDDNDGLSDDYDPNP